MRDGDASPMRKYKSSSSSSTSSPTSQPTKREIPPAVSRAWESRFGLVTDAEGLADLVGEFGPAHVVKAIGAPGAKPATAYLRKVCQSLWTDLPASGPDNDTDAAVAAAEKIAEQRRQERGKT